ncbi:hypothetical protein EGW08_004630, partial [Elysia chlorotica]
MSERTSPASTILGSQVSKKVEGSVIKGSSLGSKGGRIGRLMSLDDVNENRSAGDVVETAQRLKYNPTSSKTHETRTHSIRTEAKPLSDLTSNTGRVTSFQEQYYHQILPGEDENRVAYRTWLARQGVKFLRQSRNLENMMKKHGLSSSFLTHTEATGVDTRSNLNVPTGAHCIKTDFAITKRDKHIQNKGNVFWHTSGATDCTDVSGSELERVCKSHDKHKHRHILSHKKQRRRDFPVHPESSLNRDSQLDKSGDFVSDHSSHQKRAKMRTGVLSYNRSRLVGNNKNSDAQTSCKSILTRKSYRNAGNNTITKLRTPNCLSEKTHTLHTEKTACGIMAMNHKRPKLSAKISREGQTLKRNTLPVPTHPFPRCATPVYVRRTRSRQYDNKTTETQSPLPSSCVEHKLHKRVNSGTYGTGCDQMGKQKLLQSGKRLPLPAANENRNATSFDSGRNRSSEDSRARTSLLREEWLNAQNVQKQSLCYRISHFFEDVYVCLGKVKHYCVKMLFLLFIANSTVALLGWICLNTYYYSLQQAVDWFIVFLGAFIIDAFLLEPVCMTIAATVSANIWKECAI